MENTQPPTPQVVAPIPSVVSPVATEAPPQPMDVDSMSPAPPPPPPPSGNQDSMVMAPKPKRGFPKKLILVVLVLVLLVGLAGLVFGVVLPGLTKSTKEVSLVWWGLWEDPAVVEPLIAEYQAANPNVTIEYKKQSKEDYRERLSSTLAQGTGPDIFRIHNSWVPMFRSKLAPAPESVMSSTEFSQTFYPVATSDLVLGGQVLGLPLMYDALALYVNDDLLATFGRNAPTTWSDLVETATSTTVKDKGVVTQAGVSLGVVQNVDHWPEVLALLMLQNRASLANPGDSQGLGKGAIDYYKQFADKQLWNTALPRSTEYFATGKLAMYFGPTWEYHEIKEINPALRFSLVAVPQVPKNFPDEPNITYATYWTEGVSNVSDNADEAWKFLKFLSSSENLRKMYSATSQSRAFGEPYPRVDMRDELLSSPILKAIIEDAPDAQSWYLADKTSDGATGINSQLAQYYSDAVRGSQLSEVTMGVQQVLASYGISVR